MTPKFSVGEIVQYHFNEASLFNCAYFTITSIRIDEEGIKYEDSDGEWYDELDLISLKESHERLKDVQDLVQNQIYSAEFLLETNGKPRFKLGDYVYCHQQDERDWCEFPSTEIYWSYIYSNDADETFSDKELTLVKEGQQFPNNYCGD